MRRILLQLFRIATLVAIAWLLREHSVRMRVEALRPVTVEEVKHIFPAATALRLDAGERGGWHVVGTEGADLGYVLQTAPIADNIIGYRGWTNALVAFSPELKVLGVRIRSSQDTVEHVSDVKNDRSFLKTWNGRTWEEVVGKTPEQEGIEGVSGATMTSLAIAEGIVRRLRASDADAALPPISWRVQARDIGLAVVVVLATILAFTGTHGRQWIRRGFQLCVIVYVGFVNGDLLAQTLVIGWAQHGVPWQTAPGLVLLLAAALLVPWGTGKPLYCQHLCPHGHVQEWLSRLAPKRWRISLPQGFAKGLRWLAPATLGYALAVTMLSLPFDLASLEPFDAYLICTAGWVTIAIAVIGLGASCFVPMAYCHYGCPTGTMLNFLRSHGSKDRFGRREIAAIVLLIIAFVLSRLSVPLYEWLQSAGSDWL